MQIKVNRQHIFVYLLLCSLFLTSYISILNNNSMLSPEMRVFDTFSVSGGNKHSSTNGEANIGHDDFMATVDTSTEFTIFSVKQLRRLGTKTGISILTAIVTARLTCLIYYSRFSLETYTQSGSRIITTFLHKKDGMK